MDKTCAGFFTSATSREVMESFFLPSKPSYDRRGWRPQSAQTKATHPSSLDSTRPSSARKPRPPSASAQILLTKGPHTPTSTCNSRVSGQIQVGQQHQRPNGFDHREAPYFTTHGIAVGVPSRPIYHIKATGHSIMDSLLLLTSSRASVTRRSKC